MEKTPMPIIAGAFDIFSGVLNMIVFIGLLIGCIAIGWAAVDISGWVPGVGIALGVLIILTIFSLVVGILALVGGVYAIQRKKWSLALTGSICALVPSFFLGVAAIILTAISKDEFE